MAGRPADAGSGTAELVSTHGAGLHRVAAMLTGDTDMATRLTGLTLAQAPETSSRQQLLQRLVRAYVRTAPRRREKTLPVGTGDPGDVVARLAPRARAASVLRLVEGASVADVATALRLAPERIARLVPEQEGVDVALEALAHRHALTGDRLESELGTAVAQAPPEPPPRDRRWWWAAAAAVPLAVLGGYALSLDGEEESAPAPTFVEAAGEPVTDLTEAGFELRDDGTPPNGAAGLTLVETIDLSPGGTQQVELDTDDVRFQGQSAMFAVLWCDMPPADDPNLEPPGGIVSVAGERIPVPCAGRDAGPPVTTGHVVTLPPQGSATVEVSGDIPGDGGAVLGLYAEPPDVFQTPLPDGNLTDAPPVPDGAALVEDQALMPYGPQSATRIVQAVELTPDSTIRVWAGRTGAVSVAVDGHPVTDDGDLAGMMTDEQPDWHDQLPDVRDGRWSTYVPGQQREFALPADLLPARGERRDAVVEVTTEAGAEHLQVVATQAGRAALDLSPATQVLAPDLPELVSGHRLVGAWELPTDAHVRELESSPPDPDELRWVMLMPSDAARGRMWWSPFSGEGLLQRGRHAMPIWTMSEVAEVTQWLTTARAEPLPGMSADDPLQAAAPATRGAAPAVLLAYAPVPYQDFDFSAAAVPEHAWPTGGERGLSRYGFGDDPLETLGPEDLDESGTARVELPSGGFGVGARISTEGEGRIRFLIHDKPVDELNGTDGWWSSWTDEPVTTETGLVYGYGGTLEIPLTIIVEDYEEFTIELLRN
ncbi:hypothetical protein [Serinicoccus kebangsaanensis]|uniref:hypothetical protein n=1 Tax=Serinicoccus kebangsaanensis TaxID=2602069 RepID=UPI00124BD556|nr:hypothetical protein [Serinicoccus kebangsaanensis]